jgi:putative phosphoesterase
MRIGVFSDVHGNWEALQACLKRLKKENIEHFINCGDIIGYGPDSETCVRKVAALSNVQSVMGNHDAIFVQPEIEALFNYDAKLALEISRKTLSEKSIRFLAATPVVIHGDNFTVVHGTPWDPVKEYFSSTKQFKKNYGLWTGQVCFVGHTHLPFYMKGTLRSCSIYLNKKNDWTIPLSDKYRYVINPGAVGKPRDNNPTASFGIWDTDAKTFRFLREPYDVTATQEKMKKAKLPSFLIDSLALGL